MIDRNDLLWFKNAVIYEAHVKAFFDANGDGIGDFAGLESKLDYLQEPDCFHDLFGHVPLLINAVFADFMHAYGRAALAADNAADMRVLCLTATSCYVASVERRTRGWDAKRARERSDMQ